MSRWAWPFLIAAVFGTSLFWVTPAHAAEPRRYFTFCSVRILNYYMPNHAVEPRGSVEYASPIFEMSSEDYDVPNGEDWSHSAYSRSFAKAAFPDGEMPKGAEHGCYASSVLSSVENQRFSHMIANKNVEVAWKPTEADIEAARSYIRAQDQDRASLTPPLDSYVYCVLSYDVKYDDAPFRDQAHTYTAIMPMSDRPEVVEALSALFQKSVLEKSPEIAEKLTKPGWESIFGKNVNCTAATLKSEAERKLAREMKLHRVYSYKFIEPVMTGWSPSEADYVELTGIAPAASPAPTAPLPIVIADMNETARRAAAQAAGDEIVAADKRRRAAIGAEADRKFKADIAQGEVRAAARLAKFRERCPSLACQ
ncbi:hypothetical protein [uncultured Sphingomonas sp.]|uniref:hypothetical protein n=1 Tax=uncultured Sphingomonas sp. TaxID=158754 RepID=UPI0035CAF6E4